MEALAARGARRVACGVWLACDAGIRYAPEHGCTSSAPPSPGHTRPTMPNAAPRALTSTPLAGLV
jgi:hypothetical protein